MKGVTTYLADCEMRVQWGERRRKARKNLMPGYVLVQAEMNPRVYLEILQTESVVKFVGKPWSNLSWIPDDQVENLRLLLGVPISLLRKCLIGVPVNPWKLWPGR
ncbi:MAG: transcription termination/antitermination protein NusG [bacterium]